MNDLQPFDGDRQARFFSFRNPMEDKGEKTEVLVPLPGWEALLKAWEQLAGVVEDQEDRAILKEWLARRARGEAMAVRLEELKPELLADGLLPSRSR